MKLLAIETCTEACSVAVWNAGEVRERFEIAPRRHAELALPWAEALLAESGIARSQLDAIAVTRGPGAFTGVRLGLSLAQGIALALDLPLVGISTLAVLAQGANAGEGGTVLAALDARMGEVYAARFRRVDSFVQAMGEEVVQPPGAVPLDPTLRGAFGIGTGFAAGEGLLAKRGEALFSRIDAAALPHAGDLAALAAQAFARGEAMAPERVEPAYLRHNVALTIAEQQALRETRKKESS